HLDGGAANDQLRGDLGNDTLIGGDGNDTLYGDAGNDMLTGGLGVDTFKISYVYTVTNSTYAPGIDTLLDFSAGSAGDQIDLTLYYSTSTNARNFGAATNLFADGYARLTQAGADTLLEVNYYGPSAGSDPFKTVAILRNVNKSDLVAFNFMGINPNPVLGTGGNDSLTDTGMDNFMSGNAGNDTIKGLVGNDTIRGDNGSDQLDGGTGNDYVIGGAGNDKLIGGAGNDTLTGGEGNDVLTGNAGMDIFVMPTLSLYSNSARADNIDIITDFVSGNSGDQISMPSVYHYDSLVSTSPFLDGYARLRQSGADTVIEVDLDTYGPTSNFKTIAILRNVNKADLTAFNFQNNEPNPIQGTWGNDLMTGTGANDLILGQIGDDTLVGGGGKDQVSGGGGEDVFVINQLSDSGTSSSSWDRIADFERGEDRIDLSKLDANTATVADDAFTKFIGGTSTFSASGQLKISEGILYGNTDADADAEFAIELTGISTLDLSDFVA
ncbi:MAG: M10 family metallopeptidase C-terminal domain-containing protein, partial [Pseudomonadota bacterium]